MVSLMAAPQNGELLRLDGESSMVVSIPDQLVMLFLPLSNKAAISASIGSRALTTPL